MAPSPILPDYSDQRIKTSIVPLMDTKTIKMSRINSTISLFETYKFSENSWMPFQLKSMQISDSSDRWKNIGVLISRLSSAPGSSGDSIKFAGRMAERNSNNASLIGIYAWNANWSLSLNDQMYNMNGEFEFAPSISSAAPNNFRDTESGMDVKWGY